MTVAKEREEQGQDDLFDFVVKKKSEKYIQNFVHWKRSAPKDLERGKCVDRMAIVLERQKESCCVGCNGEWLICAREVLRNNDINTYVYADAIRQCLNKGRKKTKHSSCWTDKLR